MGGGGGGGRARGANSQQAHDVALTSMRRNNVASTSFRRHLLTRFLIKQCQIITFFILKSDNIENSTIELKGIVLQVPSNQIKVTLLLFYPSTWYICEFFCFTYKLKENVGGLLGAGAKGMLAFPLKLLGGGGGDSYSMRIFCDRMLNFYLLCIGLVHLWCSEVRLILY